MKLLEKFNIVPNNENLYEIAFTHSSYSAKYDLDYDYERLEFLGDSVLNMLTSEFLQNMHPTFSEGKLTKLRANYVCQNALIVYSHENDLDKCIRLNLEDNALTDNEVISITADVFESFLGAIYLDQGIEKAKEFLQQTVFPYIEAKTVFFYDYKSTIKEYGDAEDVEVSYELLEEHGAPHDKTFVMRILIDGVDYGHGVGKSKKEAEQLAASKAIEKLKLGK
ncbi:ribonuclease III [Methanobrevibacter sp.]|uniref:ribonuclease III n=1 Tax=Methanobrevibacter sp. TaxID=66852 RepID=UPI0025D6926C|nr:ribonuclease III [Methanobrevibacter sp.]MBQ2961337.1 ribonuclease III [Methanobrevibacter sp.]